jgi:actin-like ATPase involved in cell morphogenesis
MKPPKQTVRAHNRTVTLSSAEYADRLEAHAEALLRDVGNTYRGAPPEVQALLLARPVFVAVLSWASNRPEQH